jgi:hypothetical protein
MLAVSRLYEGGRLSRVYASLGVLNVQFFRKSTSLSVLGKSSRSILDSGKDVQIAALETKALRIGEEGDKGKVNLKVEMRG